MYKRWKCKCAPISRSNFEPTYTFSLLYTVTKISSISYPYQCLFAPSAQKKAWDRKKSRSGFAVIGQHTDSKQKTAIAYHRTRRTWRTKNLETQLTRRKKYDDHCRENDMITSENKLWLHGNQESFPFRDSLCKDIRCLRSLVLKVSAEWSEFRIGDVIFITEYWILNFMNEC